MRFDWTKSGYYQLSDKTKQVLRALKEPVNVVVFLPPSAEREYIGEGASRTSRNLLKEFQFFGKDKLRVEYVDPQRDLRPRRATRRAVQPVDTCRTSIIFACGSRHKYVSIDEHGGSSTSEDSGMGRRVKAFKGEGVFLSAIQTVTEEKPPKVYFLAGHGERDPNNPDQRDGYSTLASTSSATTSRSSVGT